MVYSINCVATATALHIEVALDPTAPQIQRLMAQTYIRSGLLVLKQAQEYWTSVEWTLRLFEWVIARKNLLPGGSVSHEPLSLAGGMAASHISDTTSGEMQADMRESHFSVPPPADLEGSEWFNDLLGFDFIDNLE